MEKEQKKSNNKRRLLLLILLLVCTLTLLGGATYAWFTANTKVAIEAMDLEVQVANGIEISADAEHWSAKLNLVDLYKAAGIPIDAGATTKHNDAGSINQFPGLLTNVSSVGNVNATAGGTNRLELFNGTAANVCFKKNPTEAEDGLLFPVVDEPTTGGVILEDCADAPVTGLTTTSAYAEGNESCKGTGEGGCANNVGVIAFDIYLKLDTNSQVSLAPGSYINDNSARTDYGLKNTIRVAFVTLGTQPNDYYSANASSIDENGVAHFEGDDTETYKTQFGGYAGVYGARNMNAFGNISIWEPNRNAHTGSAIQKAVNDYGLSDTGENAVTETTIVPTHGIYKAFGAGELPISLNNANGTDNADNFAEQKLVAAADAGTGKPYKNAINYFKTDAATAANIAAGNKGITDSQKLFVGRAGVTKVRVYMWVEGNDIDTVNSATTSKVQGVLSFTTADTEGDIADSATQTYTNPLAAVYRNNYDAETNNKPAKGELNSTDFGA